MQQYLEPDATSSQHERGGVEMLNFTVNMYNDLGIYFIFGKLESLYSSCK